MIMRYLQAIACLFRCHSYGEWVREPTLPVMIRKCQRCNKRQGKMDPYQ